MPLTNLNRKLNSQNIYRTSKKSNRRKLFKILIVLLILVALVYFPIREAYQSVKTIAFAGKQAGLAFQNEDLGQVKTSIVDMKNANGRLGISLNFLIWVRIIPFIGGYYADANSFSDAAEYELAALEKIVNILEPHKAEIGFDGQPSPGQDRVAQVVKILNIVVPDLDKIEPDLKKASDKVANIDINKYPETMGKYRLRSQVDAAKGMITGAYYAVSQARPALEVAPSALGEPSAKNYLLIFQNDSEIRATGGFMTAYATLKLDKGIVSSSTSDDIYRLDEKLLNVCKTRICPLTPPEPIVKYLPEENGKPRTAWSMRDSNLSPDVPTSLKQFEKIYEYIGDKESFDGIILIDTKVVEELIKITGPIEVLGTTYSAEKDTKCNCPNVIYELERYSQIIEKGDPDRKAILGTLMQQILARSLGVSMQKAPEFINIGTKLATSKHIIFYMHDEKTQRALSQLNWTGEIKSYKGDYLHINDSNFAGGKSNLYVEQEAILDINIGKDGKVTNKLVVTYKNPQPYNSWLNGINRDYVRIYVPKGSKLKSSKGSEVKVTTIEEELGKTVFESFIQVRPQNSTNLSFEYELPEKFTGKEYPVMIQKQGGKKDFKYTIKVNGKVKEQFNLDTDKEFNIKI